jgi:tetratricopeptide (TPR) repeat protein
MVVQKQTLLEGLRSLPGDERLLRSLAELLERDQQWKELQQIILEQLPRLPRGSALEVHVCYLGGKASLELGDLRQALGLISRSVQLRGDLWFSQHILGRVLAGLGRWAEGLQAQQRCAELAPGFPWCWFEIGKLQLELGDVQAAQEALERALDLQEHQDPGHSHLFRQALAGVEVRARQAEREEASLGLWPERQPPAAGERLPVLEELMLSLEQFRLFLDRYESQSRLG